MMTLILKIVLGAAIISFSSMLALIMLDVAEGWMKKRRKTKYGGWWVCDKCDSAHPANQMCNHRRK